MDLYKKAFKERENKYLEDIVSLEEKLRSHDRIVYKRKHSLQTIHILAQPKMYDGENLASTKLKVDLPNYKETLEDAEEKIPVEQTYFSSPSTSNVPSVSSSENIQREKERTVRYHAQNEIQKYFTNEVISISRALRKGITTIKQEITEEVQEMLEIFVSMERKVKEQAQKEKPFQNEIDRLLEASLEREIRDCVLISVEQQKKNERLMFEMEKISSESKDIQVNLLKRIKILENDFQRSQAQSINFELKLQHQKEQNACDISWKSQMAKLNGENVSLNIQIESLVQ
ncbi:hypothetical protein Tco_0947567 [Tanacetum coccineum]